MTTRLDVVNRALNELGRPEVSAITDDPNAVLINNAIGFFLPQLLQAQPWLWNLKCRVDSTPVTDSPNPAFAYAFQLPADYGRMANVDNGNAYMIMDGFLCTNQGEITYYYSVNDAVYANSNYNAMSPLFIDALTLFTAYRKAAIITAKETLVTYLKQEQRYAMDSAILQNSMELRNAGAPYNQFDRIVLI